MKLDVSIGGAGAMHSITADCVTQSVSGAGVAQGTLGADVTSSITAAGAIKVTTGVTWMLGKTGMPIICS